MKKLLFTIVFLSVISFVGISRVNALPIGGLFDYWDTNKQLIGNLIDSNGAQLPLYGYNGSGYGSCPALGVTNQLAPLSCYNTSDTNTSLLVNSYPLCVVGDCTTAASVMNLTIGLTENDFLQPNVKYNLQVDIGFRDDITEEWFTHIKAIYDTGRNFQLGYGVVTDYKVECYYSTDSSYHGGNYCSLSFDFVPDRVVGVFYVDFTTDMSLADFNYYASWILYPRIEQDEVSNFVKYTMLPTQRAFVSGVKTGKVYFDTYYRVKENPYVAYFDLSRKLNQLYANWIQYYSYTNDSKYFYYDFDLDSKNPPADLLMVSTESFKYDNSYPYKQLEFYVSPDAYVDIITPSVSGSATIYKFKYKNPNTGLIEDIVLDSLGLSNNDSFFSMVSSGLDFFKDSILNVGFMFSTFFNNLSASFSWFFITIFALAILSAIIIMFR